MFLKFSGAAFIRELAKIFALKKSNIHTKGKPAAYLYVHKL